MQTSSDVTLSNPILAGTMPPLPEIDPLSEVELEFSPLALVLLMGNSWPVWRQLFFLVNDNHFSRSTVINKS